MNILSTVDCNSCHFRYDTYDLMLGYSECPQCFGKNLKVIKQKLRSLNNESSKVVSCYDCDWKNEYEEWEFTPTSCPVCDGDVELEEVE